MPSGSQPLAGASSYGRLSLMRFATTKPARTHAGLKGGNFVTKALLKLFQNIFGSTVHRGASGEIVHRPGEVSVIDIGTFGLPSAGLLQRTFQVLVQIWPIITLALIEGPLNNSSPAS